jgi:hypothetical protein
MNFKARRQGFGLGSLLLLLVIGGSFLGTSTIFAKSFFGHKDWPKVTGEVIDVATHSSSDGTTYAPVVQYVVGSQTYKVTSSLATSSYPTKGAHLDVAYNPANPAQAEVDMGLLSQLFFWIFPVIGAGLILLGLVLFILSQRRAGKIHHLVQTGQKVQGVVVEIRQSQTTVNNAQGYQVVVSAPDGKGSTAEYISDTLTGIGGLAMADFRTHPIPIDVYLDPAEPKNYYVDISDIPGLTLDRIKELIQKAGDYTKS